ncbi:MAG: hypothetical protein ABW119_22645 [Candidatus Thiodiazotropha lotti]
MVKMILEVPGAAVTPVNPQVLVMLAGLAMVIWGSSSEVTSASVRLTSASLAISMR